MDFIYIILAAGLSKRFKSRNNDIEKQIDEILPKLTLEQKVGQVIQGDSDSVTPEDVKKYRLGSVLSGGNSAPGPLPYAETKSST